MRQRQPKRRPWLIGFAVVIGFLIISWHWKSTTHTCETCGSTRTTTSAELFFWPVYSKGDSTTLPAPDDHQHDWQLTSP